MVKSGDLQEFSNAAMLFNTKKLVHLVKYSLYIMEASSHILTKSLPVVNIKIAEDPIAIKLPDRSII